MRPGSRLSSIQVVTIGSPIIFGGAAILSFFVLVAGRNLAMPVWLLVAEIFATVVALFLFGSIKYRIAKNALAYGMVLVILATFCGLPSSEWHRQIANEGWLSWARQHVLSFRGLDELFHADAMLFILGLTLFVSVIAQTRILEGLTLLLLRKNNGRILPTVIVVTAAVAFVSGILGGVSMIGLTIRTLAIILMLAAVPRRSIVVAVMMCTAVTTVCGVWLAYGEPPALIMKANLQPHLDGWFFVRYCGPIAVAAYLVVARHLRRTLKGSRIDLDAMDVLDANAEDVRFLQAARHGEVLTPVELLDAHADRVGGAVHGVLERIRHGAALGTALVLENVPPDIRKELLGHFVTDELSDSLDRHYVLDAHGDEAGAMDAEQAVDATLAASATERRRAQVIGALAIIPLAGLLLARSRHPGLPLFFASFAGFAVAVLAIARIPRMLALALREAWHEYREYCFLFPLFLSITLLTSAGFFASVEHAMRSGLEASGREHFAWAQFFGSTVLSAVFDNNVVADFGSRGLQHLELGLLQLFAMAQVAGYALGGCWTHLGCAQSLVAYSFVRRDVDDRFTPFEWIRVMTPAIVELFIVITILIYLESAWFRAVE